MKTSNYKTRFIILSVMFMILAVLCGKSVWDHNMLTIRTSFAVEQCKIFDDMRIKASRSDVNEAIGSLEYVVNYYPSGTKQIEGSNLDHLVENARTNAVARIVSDLRTRSGEDFGDDPQCWINRK